MTRNVAAILQQANGMGMLNSAVTEGEANAAKREIARAQAKQVPLGKDALSTFLGIFMSRASHYNSRGTEPDPDDPKKVRDKNPNANEAKFEKWARLAVDTAKAVAPYQSPTFRAIMMAPPPPENAPKRRFTLTIHDTRNGSTVVAQTNADESAPVIDAIADEAEKEK
jgi:hypothetical protein